LYDNQKKLNLVKNTIFR